MILHLKVLNSSSTFAPYYQHPVSSSIRPPRDGTGRGNLYGSDFTVSRSFNDPRRELNRREEPAVGVYPEVGDLTCSFFLEDSARRPASSQRGGLTAKRLLVQSQTGTRGGTVPVRRELWECRDILDLWVHCRQRMLQSKPSDHTWITWYSTLISTFVCVRKHLFLNWI